ncbi:MAG: ABC transporter permease [Ignavibacteria bacterium]|nr:ABC transporter permease [Ignavibacteria bacterium]
MRRIRELMIKEFLQIRRDKRMLPVIIVAPILQVIILGYAAAVDVKNVGTVVCDLDRSARSRELVTRFTNTGYFTIIDYVDHPREIDRFLDETKAIVGIVIPKHFGRAIAGGKTTSLQVFADGTDANTANISLGYVSQIVGGLSESIVTERLLRTGGMVSVPRVRAETRVWYNPELRSANFMVPGVVALLLFIITAAFTSIAIVREREAGTMEQLMVTPIRPYQLILGKLLPFVVIGLLDVVLVLGVATLWFNIPMKGSLILLFILTGAYILNTLGIGLFVSTISRTQQQALMTAQFFIMFPSIFLSGFTFPIENMPEIVQGITYLVPLRYFMTIIRGLFLKGVGLEALWLESLILFGSGVLILSLSVIRFRKRLA